MPLTKQLFWLACALALAIPRSAQATYSILAVDRASEHVGGAGTSCIDGADVYIIYRSVPGIGVVHTQATINYDGRDRAIELLEQRVAPGEILSEITSLRFDPAASIRQYAIANVTGQVAAFTGEETRSYAADLQGSAGAFGYSVQGNILTGAQVLTQVASAFELDGCDLAERLMRALAAGADNGHGDSRCTEERGIPSDSAFLQVDRPGEPAGDYLSLRVPTSGQQNPLVVLREQYDQWRSAHPCLAPTPDLGTASMASSAGVGGAGSSETSTSGANSAVQDGVTAPSASGSGGGNISPGADGSDGLVQRRAEQPGCACATSSRSDDGSPLAGIMLLFAAARLRKSARDPYRRRSAGGSKDPAQPLDHRADSLTTTSMSTEWGEVGFCRRTNPGEPSLPRC